MYFWKSFMGKWNLGPSKKTGYFPAQTGVTTEYFRGVKLFLLGSPFITVGSLRFASCWFYCRRLGLWSWIVESDSPGSQAGCCRSVDAVTVGTCLKPLCHRLLNSVRIKITLMCMVTVHPSWPRTVPIHAACPEVIVTISPFHTQKCPILGDKL